MALLQYLFFWNLKAPEHNKWHPEPGKSPTQYIDNLPLSLKQLDVPATVVDSAPVIAGVGGLAHLSQAHAFGFTARASVFRNVKTLTAIHTTTLVVAPLILALQASGFEYRYFIPRWASDRELRRDEEEVRQHVDVGMAFGSLSWIGRLAFKLGARYWAPIDVIMGGALADLMHREYLKAHGF
ncbi:Hypothetical predicted protein [Lecanosticta acicola]|uniref:Uncharacterized protein n=1 Tax=Lecanosticta acicola TaxID=111012 RepID=A0AAI9E8T9_9PEZI|nr:Hypothetical predicted protein [Lecanosticta acicola]